MSGATKRLGEFRGVIDDTTTAPSPDTVQVNFAIPDSGVVQGKPKAKTWTCPCCGARTGWNETHVCPVIERGCNRHD